MFSFFKTKKTHEDPIPSASGSDFEIVNPPAPGPSQPNPQPYPYPIYPNFNNAGYPPMYPPAFPTYPPAARPTLQHSDSVQHSNALSGVPFKLSPELTTEDFREILQIQVDDIFASLTQRMQIAQLDYDFTLEKSILQQDVTDSTESEPEKDAEAEDNPEE